MNLVVHTDGGARGNPGPAAVGVVIEDAVVGKQTTGRVIAEFGKRIGETTNNVAEYSAVVEALQYLVSHRPQTSGDGTALTVDFYLDSTLVVHQLNGLFKVKEPHLRELLFTVRQTEQELGGVIRYHVVRREYNRRADFFVNQALDRE
jgi:ribonuclease HI